MRCKFIWFDARQCQNEAQSPSLVCSIHAQIKCDGCGNQATQEAVIAPGTPNQVIMPLCSDCDQERGTIVSDAMIRSALWATLNPDKAHDPAAQQAELQRIEAIQAKYATPPEYEGNQFYEDGVTACEEGHNFILGQPAPYPKGTDRHEAWVAGYMNAGKRDQEIDRPFMEKLGPAVIAQLTEKLKSSLGKNI